MKVFYSNDNSFSLIALKKIMQDRTFTAVELNSDSEILSELNSNSSSLAIIEINKITEMWLLTGRFKIFSEIYLIHKDHTENSPTNHLKKIYSFIKSNNNIKRFILIGRSFFDFPESKSNKVSVILNLGNSSFDSLKESLKNTKLKITNAIESAEDKRIWLVDLKFTSTLDLTPLETFSEDIHILGIYQNGRRVNV